ncbi:MAG: hypothetical protein AAGF95_29695 [Chloroflexota bacterium]
MSPAHSTCFTHQIAGSKGASPEPGVSGGGPLYREQSEQWSGKAAEHPANHPPKETGAHESRASPSTSHREACPPTLQGGEAVLCGVQGRSTAA